MPSAVFELAIPTIKRLQTYALHRAVTGIGISVFYKTQIVERKDATDD
jgi:hypothetical protein